jgi:MoaA/NifB/PqqE/SkfB family radical SAM enzyme
MIEAFYRLKGVPMVLNTSFNRRGEPIVCTPSDAVESFVGLGADLLAIGDFLVEPLRAEVPARPDVGELARLPGGRRLALRLTTRCDYNCGHCTLRDQHGRPDRTFDDAQRSLVEGRQAGCDEVVFMRGEPTLRSDLAELVAAARAMGYRFVQVQTNGYALAQPAWRERLLRAGVGSFEVMVLADDERLHNELSDRPGSFVPAMTALKALAASDRELLVTVPVLRRNQRRLRPIVALLKRLGVQRVQFNFPRPVELKDRVITEPLPRLSIAARYVAQAARAAVQLGMQVTTEAFPDCLLPPELHGSPDAVEDFGRHRIDDLHLVHESLGAVRTTQRPEAPACRECSHRQSCPRTWGLYLELVGTDELTPIRPATVPEVPGGNAATHST